MLDKGFSIAVTWLGYQHDQLFALSDFHFLLQVAVYGFKLFCLRLKLLLNICGSEDVLQIDPIFLSLDPIIDCFLRVQTIRFEFLGLRSQHLEISGPQDITDIR